MISTPARRGRHHKRLSSLRLSSDSTVSALPAYTSPPWNRPQELGDISDRPPDYPDSAEEGDADTDSDTDAHVVYIQPAALPRLPRRSPRSPPPRSTRRQQQNSAGDPYLDSLLERSVHALEMSNALLQSSMSTQSSLSAVLSSDSMADRSLEARARLLSSRIIGNRDLHHTWMEDLDEISQSVESLVADEEAYEEGKDTFDEQSLPLQRYSISKSLPTSGLAEHVRKGHMRRPSLDLRNASTAQLQYSNHERSHFVAPPPRAMTMYVDSSDDPDLITLPPTLGLRTTSHLPPTPLPSETFSHSSSDLPSSESTEQTKRIMDVLSSYAVRSPPSRSSTPSSIASSRPPQSISGRSERSSSTSSRTVRRPGQSKSPPKSLSIKTPSPSRSSSMFRSRSLTPRRSSSPPPPPTRPMTPPIEELSASSTSSSSDSMHVDRSVQSLRQILIKQPAPPATSASCSKPHQTAPPPPRPAFLQPPAVSAASGTSTATASISRLFTKARHSSSTRAPSPPRHSSLKSPSAPTTPVTPNSPAGLRTPASSSGRSTPKRISFAELPESYSGSKPDGAPRFRDKARDRDKRGKNKGKGRAAAEDSDSELGTGWWTGWLLGVAGTGNGTGLSVSAVREERLPRTQPWSLRPGFGNSLEDWGA